MSQIWLNLIQQTIDFFKESCLILASKRNSLSKYGGMWLFSLKNMATFAIFFHQKMKDPCRIPNLKGAKI
jgi:hypothetical protein